MAITVEEVFYQFENDFVESDDGTVKAFYGGLFQHKGNVRRVSD